MRRRKAAVERILSEETWEQVSQADPPVLGKPNPGQLLGAEIQAGSWNVLRTFPWRVYICCATTG